ncbi:MAG TPA: cell wall metabolism sensor histidine kinase WalK [Dehalococcoidia bacterium]|nr:cell wall metabolism sensor histidine kinase WalK [Dehalococcoidia bacterium]
MFRSIRWRTATVFAVLILLCICGLSIYLAHFFESRYVDNLREQLTDQAYLIGDSSLSYITGERSEELDALAKRLGEKTDARVTIIDRDGVVLGDSEENPADMENHANRPEIQEALALGSGSSIRFSTTLGYDMMYVAVPISVNSTIVGTARVSLPLTEIDEALGHINRTIIWVAIIAAFITILLALHISKITTDPVRKLTQLSQKIAQGDLDHEIQINSSDEVGDLAKAFNLMAVRLKEMIALITAERDRMAVTLSHMDNGIVVVNGDSQITLMNTAAERMLQISGEEALGHTFVEAARDYELDEILKRCLKTREQQTGTVETSPEKKLLGVIATPLDEDSGCLLLFQDLTELRRLEAVRRDFVSNISHELRTPIASLKALAETLHEGAINDPSVAKEFLSKINAELDKLAQMVQELGELSHIESGEVPFHITSFAIVDSITRAIERLRLQADRAGLNIETDFPPALPDVAADQERVEQVLGNLIHNAIKFTQPGGSINIAVKEKDDSILVAVSDTGIGIPADDLPRIFERFYKADKARSGGGTGLGLAIAKHIIEGHGGKIWAESVEGKGSTFNFTLPSASRT